MNSDTLLLANAGTALMWASACHLVAGNLVIGLVEGLLISLFVKGRRWKAAGWMILANYASAWLGYVLLTVGLPLALRTTEQRITIENLVAWHVAALAVAYVLTLVVEFPFVVAALGRDVRFGTRIRVNLLAQTASYVLLVGGYALVSANSIAPWGLTVAKPATFARDADVWVYYVGQSDAVVRSRPSGEALEQVAGNLDARPNRLRALRHAGETIWDLYVEYAWPTTPKNVLVLSSFSNDVACDPNSEMYLDDSDLTPSVSTPESNVSASRPARGYDLDSPAGNWFDQPAGRFDGNPRADQRIVGGNWPIVGLRIEGGGRYKRLIAVETPLAAWPAMYPVILPSRQIVFQLGEQIVLLDLDQKKIGLLDIGAGLVVTRGSTLD